MMPNDNITAIKEKVSLLQIVKERIKVNKRGGRYLALCPFHKEKTPSFTIDPTKDLFHCFGCGKGGDIFEFLSLYENLSFKDALEYLANVAGINLSKNFNTYNVESSKQKKSFYDLLSEANVWFNHQLLLPENSQALDYLYKRGISKYTIDSLKLGYAPEKKDSLSDFLILKGFKEEDIINLGLKTIGEKGNYDTFRDRIIFPIKNKLGKVIAFGGRKLKNEGPKYLNSKESVVFHKKYNLFGLSEALKIVKETKAIILVEGYFDVIVLQQVGFAAVAPLGTAVSKEQIEIVVNLQVPIFMCLDGDAAGKAATLKVVQLLLEVMDENSLPKFISLPTGEDPDSFFQKNTKEDFISLLNNAFLLSEFLWEETVKNLQLDSPEIYALLKKKFNYYCSLIKNPNLKIAYANYFESKINDSFYSNSINNTANFSNYKPEVYYRKNKLKKESNVIKTKISIANNKFLQNNITKNNLLTREYQFLAYIIFCPEIYNVVGQDFALLSFSTHELEKLRQKLVFLLEDNNWDTKSLQEELAKSGFITILNKIIKILPIKMALNRLKQPEDFIKAFYELKNRELYSLLNNDILDIKESLSQSKETNNFAINITNKMQQLQHELKKTKSFKGKLE